MRAMRAVEKANNAHAAPITLVEVCVIDKQTVDAQSAAGGISEALRYKQCGISTRERLAYSMQCIGGGGVDGISSGPNEGC